MSQSASGLEHDLYMGGGGGTCKKKKKAYIMQNSKHKKTKWIHIEGQHVRKCFSIILGTPEISVPTDNPKTFECLIACFQQVKNKSETVVSHSVHTRHNRV
jgi:hypothetical protein